MTDNKQALYYELMDLARAMSEIVNNQKLIEAFKQELPKTLNYNAGHLLAIEDKAAPALRDHLSGLSTEHLSTDKEIQARALHEIFSDPIAKTSQMILMGASAQRDDLILQNLHDADKCLSDIMDNFPRLLFNGMPDDINKGLIAYGKLAPKVKDAFKKLNALQETQYTPDPDNNYYDGKNHLKRLPVEFVILQDPVHVRLTDIIKEIEDIAAEVGIFDPEYDKNMKRIVEIMRITKDDKNIEVRAALKDEKITTKALRSVFEQMEFDESHLQDIEEAATVSLSNDIKTSGLPMALSAAFIDPFNKVLTIIKPPIDAEYYNNLPRELDEGIKILKDIISNYPRLLGNNIPEAIKDALEGYEDIVPLFKEAFELVETKMETPYTPDPNIPYDEGKEHLGRLPDRFTTPNMKTQGPAGPACT